MRKGEVRVTEFIFGNKKWLILSVSFLLCAFLLFLAGFYMFNRWKEDYVRYTPDQVTDKIISDLKDTDFVKVDKSQISKHYDIPDGTISDFSLYMSKSSESASELACFLLTDQSAFDRLQTSVNAHISTKAAGFKSLNPTQYNQLKDFLLVRHGLYVLVAVGSDIAAEEKTFQSLMA
jgi:hypothetical protein